MNDSFDCADLLPFVEPSPDGFELFVQSCFVILFTSVNVLEEIDYSRVANIVNTVVCVCVCVCARAHALSLSACMRASGSTTVALQTPSHRVVHACVRACITHMHINACQPPLLRATSPPRPSFCCTLALLLFPLHMAHQLALPAVCLFHEQSCISRPLPPLHRFPCHDCFTYVSPPLPFSPRFSPALNHHPSSPAHLTIP